jgi:hypothetical protein
MRRRHGLTVWLIVGLSIVAVGCGGDDDASGEVGATSTGSIDSSPDIASGSDGIAPEQPGGGGTIATNDIAPAGVADVPVPVARFAAHGPQAANTIGPPCADGIDTRGGDVFRFTPPASWEWRGTSSGTGSDEVELVDADGVSMYVAESAYDTDTAILPGWSVTGPSGVDLDLDGETIPMMNVTLDGAPGYAIVDLPYLAPLPLLSAGALGTVAVTSDVAGRPTIEEATELLESVRIERCEAVGQSLIWGPAGGVHLVPRFEPDPLGKVYPDQPQPAYEPTKSALASYSVEQLAYLMPVGADVAACAASQAQGLASDPIAYLKMLTPTGTNKQQLADIVASC